MTSRARWGRDFPDQNGYPLGQRNGTVCLLLNCSEIGRKRLRAIFVHADDFQKAPYAGERLCQIMGHRVNQCPKRCLLHARASVMPKAPA